MCFRYIGIQQPRDTGAVGERWAPRRPPATRNSNSWTLSPTPLGVMPMCVTHWPCDPPSTRYEEMAGGRRAATKNNYTSSKLQFQWHRRNHASYSLFFITFPGDSVQGVCMCGLPPATTKVQCRSCPALIQVPS
jgi:hypothetical protein